MQVVGCFDFVSYFLARYKNENNNIQIHNKNTAFSVLIFMKLKITQERFVQISLILSFNQITQ